MQRWTKHLQNILIRPKTTQLGSIFLLIKYSISILIFAVSGTKDRNGHQSLPLNLGQGPLLRQRPVPPAPLQSISNTFLTIVHFFLLLAACDSQTPDKWDLWEFHASESLMSNCLGLFNSRSFFDLGCDADNHPVVWSFVQASSSHRWRSGPLSQRSPVSITWYSATPLVYHFQCNKSLVQRITCIIGPSFGNFLENFQHEGWYMHKVQRAKSEQIKALWGRCDVVSQVDL